MKKTHLVIFLCFALVCGLIGYSIRPKSADSTKPIATNGTKVSTSEINNSKPDTEMTYKRDLNKDGVEETIKIIFQYEKPGTLKKYSIIITSDSRQYTYEAEDDNIIANVKFADFDTKDKYIEFYINDDGPSGDPSSKIYRFDNGEIKKICATSGYIKEYNGEGQIYTDFSKTNDKFGVVLSYYDINKVKEVFSNKTDLIGKKLQYDNSLILFTDLAYKEGSCQSYIDDNFGKENVQKIIAGYNKDTIVKVCEPNEALEIVDVDNTYHGLFKDGITRNIRIKVKTSDGKEGWLDWLNGGD
jgi:hypothetical protein